MPMIECSPSIFMLEPTKITPSKYISFFVKCNSGNLLFPCVASSSTFEDSWAALHEQGGVAMQLLGDMHFATKHNDRLFEEFDALTYCSQGEEADVRRKVQNVLAFKFERLELAKGVIAIPTPGHRPGAVSYLVEMAEASVMFAGDSIWHDGSQWKALASKKNAKTMRDSLAALKQESFQSLYVNSSVTNPTFSIKFESNKEKNDFLDELAAAL